MLFRSGGEGGLGATDGVELAVFGTQGPRELLAAWLDRPRTGDITQAPIDPARRARWTFNASLDLGFQLVSSANPAGGPRGGTVAPYSNPQLSRSDTMALRGDAPRTGATEPGHFRHAAADHSRLSNGGAAHGGIGQGFDRGLEGARLQI